MNSLATSRQSLDWRPDFTVPVMRFRPVSRKFPVTYFRPVYDLPGLGQSPTQLTEEGISLATTGVAVGATIAGAAAIGAIAGPIGEIAGSLVALLSSVFSGCGQACVLESNAANQIEQILQQNVAAYLASGHTQSERAAALANFDNTWAKLTQYCGNASFGTSGQNCIADRQRGSCKWKTSPGGWQQNSSGVWNYVYPGAAGSGSECWNWFVGYRDPIANDPTVVPDAVSPSTAIATTGNSVASEVSSAWTQLESVLPSGSIGPLVLIVGGLILLAVLS